MGKGGSQVFLTFLGSSVLKQYCSLLGNNTWVSEIKIAEIIPRWEKWASLLKTATFLYLVIKERIPTRGC